MISPAVLASLPIGGHAGNSSAFLEAILQLRSKLALQGDKMIGITRRIGILGATSLLFVLAGATAAFAQKPPGTIQLAVDATEAPRGILHTRLVVPANPGPLTLFYPEWIPGEHMPSGPIANLMGLKIGAAGKPLAWRRDLVDMFAFHCTVPEGADAVEVQFDFMSSVSSARFSSGASATEKLAVISWNSVLLYPAGWPIRDLSYQARLRLPTGWRFGTALPVAHQEGNDIQFEPATLNSLVDSPVLAGEYYRVIQLSPGETPSHEIDMASDSTAALEMSPDLVEHYKQLVAETGALYGARHYRDYHFLFTLSDYVAHFGLEHHESSDDRVAERTLLDPALRRNEAGLLPHEFTHSWNGKYRRPYDLATPDFQQPMKDDLLWVYEGLTEYLGLVLTGRSGLCAPEECREDWAFMAATLDHRSGRTWRSVQDTADSASFLYEAPRQWTSRRRTTDFYEESALIWLEADTIIRRQTHDHRSMDDFCHLFHGGQNGGPELKTYTFDDVVDTLNQVAPYDWRGFLTERLTSLSPHAPLGGIEASGWRLVYSDAPNTAQSDKEQADAVVNQSFSIGMIVEDNGEIRDVIPGMPADKAGLSPGMKLLAINGRQWSAEALREAVRASKSATAPLELTVENTEYHKNYRLDYHDGARFPHLERATSQPDLLSEILRPHARAVR
jgi:predicted metalloprotease with PDZ domain